MAVRALLNSLRPSPNYGITIVSVETCRLIHSVQFNDNLEWDPW